VPDNARQAPLGHAQRRTVKLQSLREAHEPGQRDLAPSFCVRLRCNGRAR